MELKEKREEMVRYLIEREIQTGHATRQCDIPFWMREGQYYQDYADNYRNELLKSNKTIAEDRPLTDEERVVFDALETTPIEERTEEQIKQEDELKRKLKLKLIAEAHTPKSADEKRREYNKRRYEKLKSSDIQISSAFALGEPVVCPSCGGSNVSKSGYILKAREKRQRYLCKSCSYVFSEKF